jgi:tetratricopeptide (TPR) repeat protein
MNRGEFEKALNYLNESLEISERINEKKISASVCYLMGAIHVRMGNDEKGLDFIEKSLEVREEIKDERGLAVSYMGLGNLYGKQSDHENALRYLFKCLDIRKRMGDQVGLSDVEYNIGLIYSTIEEYEKALDYYKSSLIIWERIGDQPNIAVSRYAFGEVLRDMGDCIEAERYIRESIRICEEIGYKELLPFAINELAMCVIKNENDLEQAKDLCEKSITMSRNLGLKEAEGYSLQIFAEIYREMKEWAMSIEKYEESIKIFKSMPRPSYLGEAYFEYGKMWKEKGDIDKAKECLEKALGILKDSKHEKRAERVKRELAELGE